MVETPLHIPLTTVPCVTLLYRMVVQMCLYQGMIRGVHAPDYFHVLHVST